VNAKIVAKLVTATIPVGEKRMADNHRSCAISTPNGHFKHLARSPHRLDSVTAHLGVECGADEAVGPALVS